MPALPEAIEAEMTVLGSMMIDREAWAAIAADLKPEHFYRPANQALYHVICSIHEFGAPPEIPLIMQGLQSMSLMGKIATTEREVWNYITSIIDSSPSSDPTYVRYHADHIKKKWLARQILKEFAGFNKAIQEGTDPREVLSKAYSWTNELMKEDTRKLYDHLAPALTEAWEFIESRHNDNRPVTGIPTGIASFDKITMGFQPGDYVIIAARPSQGKTAIMLQTAVQAAKAGQAVGIFSLEMTAPNLAQRLLSHTAGISGKSIRTGALDEYAWSRLTDWYGKLYDWPIYISDKPGMHIREIPVIARRLVAEHNVKVLMLDYIGLVDTDKMGTRQEEVSRVSRCFQNIARDLKVPFIALSQLNRASEYEKDSEPKAAQLRESGSLEQDADVIVLIHNPKNDTDPHNVLPRPAKLIIEKQRNLPTGKVEVEWNGNTQRFADKAEE